MRRRPATAGWPRPPAALAPCRPLCRANRPATPPPTGSLRPRPAGYTRCAGRRRAARRPATGAGRRTGVRLRKHVHRAARPSDTRWRSSVGQSEGFITPRSAVRIRPPPFSRVFAHSCLSLPTPDRTGRCDDSGAEPVVAVSLASRPVRTTSGTTLTTTPPPRTLSVCVVWASGGNPCDHRHRRPGDGPIT